MVALSLRQPWAWMIIHGGKDVENRKWVSSKEGWVFIHAAATLGLSEYHEAMCFAQPRMDAVTWQKVPARGNIGRGGIVGAMKISPSDRGIVSKWRMDGQFPIPVLEVRALPFVPCKGMLNYFTPAVASDALTACA